MKNLINKLKQPDLFYKPEMPTNFLNEIDNGKKQTLEEYVKSFSKRRHKEEKCLRNTDIFLNVLQALFLAFCFGIIYLAINR